MDKKDAGKKGEWMYSDEVKSHFFNPQNVLMGDEAEYERGRQRRFGKPVEVVSGWSVFHG